jgi:isopentenyl diphosphate isomerase/L-lactate dehydrogenase-like FMN-dependent dehydrogenase
MVRDSAMDIRRAINIEDLRRAARSRVPRVIFDYLDGGADSEVTLAENNRAFNDVVFRPRGAVALPAYDLRTTVLGHELSFPAILAPIGYSGVMFANGEVAAARAASKAGLGYILSTISCCKLEDVHAAFSTAAAPAKAPLWFQLYLVGGREATEATIERAQRAGYSALVVTVDSPIAGNRERDLRNGIKELLGSSPFAKIPHLPDLLSHPRWLFSYLAAGGLPKLQNVILPGTGPMPLMDVVSALSRAAIQWSDLDWIRRLWRGPVVVKGILTGEDAKRAIQAGASAVVVSNHGGRQLDTVSASLRALPEVAAAVNGQIEVLMDGGVRRGADIVKAICLGARAVLIGRAYAYGLAAAGEAGIARAIEILRTDCDRTLRLLGCPAVSALDSSFIEMRSWASPSSWRS